MRWQYLHNPYARAIAIVTSLLRSSNPKALLMNRLALSLTI
jgi:hypothetical protein